MASVADSPRRHFLSWHRPLLPQAVAWLAGGWPGDSPLDLTGWLVVVPTRQSGRRLREALAEAAAERGQAVFPPRVVTPEWLTTREAVPDRATRLMSVLAWAGVFRTIDLENFREVFPRDPPARTFAWTLRLAREFVRLQATLAEGGLRIRDVAERAGRDCPEAARWETLGELERLYSARLAAAGRRDEQELKIASARRLPPLPGVERIVMIATPDPLPLALIALANRADPVPVDILVYAPESEAGSFDAWGRPIATGSGASASGSPGWDQREVTLTDVERCVQLCADPSAQAGRVAEMARAYDRPADRMGVGVADPEVVSPLEHALERAGVPAFNPEGRARRHDALHALLAALAALAAEPDCAAAAALLRCPDVLAWLRAQTGETFSPAAVLAQLDDLQAAHLPPTLEAARDHASAFPAVAPALDALLELHGVLTSGRFPDNAAATLARIFGARRVDAAGALAESAEAWTGILREAAGALAAIPSGGPDLAEAWEFAREEFAALTRATERPPGAIDLLGWLELLWEDAPHLIVCGMNDGRVPDAVTDDAFLPETLRVRLGLKSNATRLARDAYLLSALAASRAGAGRLDLLVGRCSAQGDPLRPSRLLLRCPDDVLPQRVALLFTPATPARAGLSWSRSWQLQARSVPPPAGMRVTALRDWLACPFRFYLRHVLRLTSVDLAKVELDAGDFGTLLHRALQELGEDAALRDCTDEAALAAFLLDRFERASRARYGTLLTLPLVVQFEAARQRLRAAAAVEARERAGGWRTLRVEWGFSFPLGGLTVQGRIDRIDRHADGRVRVLDYKTGDRAQVPAQSHLRPPRPADDSRPEWLRCPDAKGRERVWIDLQLPLYRRAAAAEWGADVACGYFNLPKAAGETAVVVWDDFAPHEQAAAERCAESVAAAVAAGVFWPPAELAGREAEGDEFAELFHQGAAASIGFRGGPPGGAVPEAGG